jgi:hypothetical protein
VIRGAVVGVWLGFYLALGKEMEKREKLLKKVVKYFGRPLSKFLNTPLSKDITLSAAL